MSVTFLDVASVVPAVGGIFSALTARHNMKRQYKYNTKLQEQAAKLQMDAWKEQFNMQNAYNDPAAQRTRLQAAGMNPNLAYGNQWISSMSPAASAPSSAVGEHGQGSASVAQGMAQSAQIMSMLDVNKSIAEKNRADAELARQQAEGQGMQNDITQSTMQDIIERASLENSEIYHRIGLYTKQQKLAYEQALTEQFNRTMADQRNQREWKQLSLNQQQIYLDFYVKCVSNYIAYEGVKVQQEQLKINWANYQISKAIGSAQVQNLLAQAFKYVQEGNLAQSNNEKVRIELKPGVFGEYSIAEFTAMNNALQSYEQWNYTYEQAERTFQETFNLSEENARAWLKMYGYGTTYKNSVTILGQGSSWEWNNRPNAPMPPLYPLPRAEARRNRKK